MYMYICRSITTIIIAREETQLYLAGSKRLYNKKRKATISYEKRHY